MCGLQMGPVAVGISAFLSLVLLVSLNTGILEFSYSRVTVIFLRYPVETVIAKMKLSFFRIAFS